MSSAPLTATARPSGRLRPQWTRSLAVSLRAFATMWLWFWAFVLVVLALAFVLIIALADDVEMSVVQFVRNGGVWFPFALAIIIAAGYLPFHVANGMTRRSFIIGTLGASVLASILYGLSMSLAMVAESALFARMGWSHSAQTDSFEAVGIWEHGFGAMLLSYTLSVLAAHVCGLLVALAYYRFRALRGTLLLPLTVAPLLLVLVITGYIGDLTVLSWERTGPTVPLTALALAVTALGAIAFHLLTRRVPITRKLS